MRINCELSSTRFRRLSLCDYLAASGNAPGLRLQSNRADVRKASLCRRLRCPVRATNSVELEHIRAVEYHAWR